MFQNIVTDFILMHNFWRKSIAHCTAWILLSPGFDQLDLEMLSMVSMIPGWTCKFVAKKIIIVKKFN